MGSGGGSTKFGKGSGTSSTRTRIPPFLQQFLQQATGAAEGSLGSLEQLFGGDLAADFDPLEVQAQDLAESRATGGPFISTAQDTFLDAATSEEGVAGFVPEGALDTLSGAAAGADISSFIPKDALDAFKAAASGADTGDLGALRTFAEQSGIPVETLEALTATTRGDFLFGGEGFDQAVQAAVNAARPQIQSVFGRAGAGGATSGLAQAAVGESATDAFARQFSQERGRQLSAADRLAGLSLTDKGQRADIFAALEEFGLTGAGELAGLGETERGRGLASAGLLGEFGNIAEDRKLDAASRLPGLGEADINLLSRTGREKRAGAQREIDAPILGQLQLLASALGGLPIENLLGSKTNAKGRTFDQLFFGEGSFGSKGGGGGSGGGGKGG